MKLPKQSNRFTRVLVFSAVCLASVHALAAPTEVTVTIENVAPDTGTFQTPVWVGLHDGINFDIYNGGQAASSLPNPGSLNELGQSAFEALCEDGNNAQISVDFTALQPSGQQAVVAGPNGPIAPGDITSFTFTVDSNDANTRFFSYASMVLPSNDLCIANGSPVAHPLFDENGNFVAQSFFVSAPEVLDAGTEVNDELEANTAFFGQAAPNTGVIESGTVRDTIDDAPNNGFLRPDADNPAISILETPRFAEADFNLNGYSMLKFTFSAVDVTPPEIIDDVRLKSVLLRGNNVVPSVATRSIAIARGLLTDNGTSLKFLIAARVVGGNANVTAIELRQGVVGENGSLLADLGAVGTRHDGRRLTRLDANLQAADLLGPLAGQTLSDLVAEIDAGNVYISISTNRNPDGEIRAQMSTR